MKKIAIIMIWGGKFPKYIKPWLITCKANKTIDFFLFTDQKLDGLELPFNVKYMHYSLEELKVKFQDNFNFPISLGAWYKICDFRPAFGEIFSDILEQYDFWGHCDMDMVFGDLRKWFTEENLCKYDRVFTCGPLSIYKNTSKVNAYYRTLKTAGGKDWKDVFAREDFCSFDEWHEGGLSYIMDRCDVPIYLEQPFDKCEVLDIIYAGARLYNENTGFGDFRIHFSDGKLYIEKDREIHEVAYAHLQRRLHYAKIDENIDDTFYIISPAIYTTDLQSHKMERLIQSLHANVKSIIFHTHNWLGFYKSKLFRCLKNENDTK